MRVMKDMVLFHCAECQKDLVFSFDPTNTVDILQQMSQLQEHVEHVSYSITLNTVAKDDVKRLLELVRARALKSLNELVVIDVPSVDVPMTTN